MIWQIQYPLREIKNITLSSLTVNFTIVIKMSHVQVGKFDTIHEILIQLFYSLFFVVVVSMQFDDFFFI